ncbi:LysR substrate-binding domain-containing protein [Neorhizobium sp. NCHU2750]|uniref:LysR family transcriptional regulator n=1 Tax=Neorhizobium sp. NCHU2750 TaxID=1825976 RepID=UPI000E759771|nr:hypothetical protein NCHU2750_44550 [Neorhizobium sp. NCHU2750]
MDHSLSAVSLRRLQVFLTVCETLHMARAAERLGVAQPALSQQIAALEDALGAKLFHRYGRGIELTAAGHACRAEAEKLLAFHQSAIDSVRRTARGDTGRIALGYVGSSMFTHEFPAQLKAMRESAPGVEFVLREGGIAIQLVGLQAGDLDAALVRGPVVVQPPLRYRLHSRQELVVILPGDHPLAEWPEIPIEKLASESMIGFRDTDNVGIGSVVSKLAEAKGCKLEVKWRVTEIGSILGLVAAGLGYGIVPKEVASYTSHRIVMRPLAEPGANTELWLVWNEQKETPALSRFLDIAVPPAGSDE